MITVPCIQASTILMRGLSFECQNSAARRAGVLLVPPQDQPTPPKGLCPVEQCRKMSWISLHFPISTFPRPPRFQRCQAKSEICTWKNPDSAEITNQHVATWSNCSLALTGKTTMLAGSGRPRKACDLCKRQRVSALARVCDKSDRKR